MVFGGLLAAGDSVRATASLLDVKTGRTLAEFERRDIGGRMDRLSDSLTLAVLRELGRSRRIDMAHATSSPTASLAALKTYLQGEQFYRAAVWDSAQMHFERGAGARYVRSRSRTIGSLPFGAGATCTIRPTPSRSC